MSVLSDKQFVVVGVVGGIAAIYLIYKMSQGAAKVAEKVGEGAEAVTDFVSNDNLLSEVNDNVIYNLSGGRFYGLGDVFYWAAGGERREREILGPNSNRAE